MTLELAEDTGKVAPPKAGIGVAGNSMGRGEWGQMDVSAETIARLHFVILSEVKGLAVMGEIPHFAQNDSAGHS